MMLDSAKQRVLTAGVVQPEVRQRHGDLVESLRELESDTRLLVIGKQGEDSGTDLQLIGSQLESVIRTLHRPILVTPASFAVPTSVMLAFDGSATSRKGVEMLASSPLFKGIPIHLVMVGEDTGDNRALLDAARDALSAAGFEVQIAIRGGEVEPALHAYQAEHGIGLLVMGAYGHSRIRQFLVGSTTTSMIRSTTTPLLLLR
jgi:nucleotide-binding universal stress UspA family protein